MFFHVLGMIVTAAFGSWESPITSDVIVQESISFHEMHTDGESIYWTELHPKEKGRLALMQYTPENKAKPLLPEISVISRVHEYGGGAFCVHQGNVYFSNDSDKQLYVLKKTGELAQITDTPNCRYADGFVSSDGEKQFWVCEKHTKNEVENFLVCISKNTVQKIASGHDFYSSPRLSPDGKNFAFITWDFPNMPWDGSTLWLAEIDEKGMLHNKRAVAGGPNESICQIQWSSEGKLFFISDRTGFWNLYCFNHGKSETICSKEAEFGIPAWVFGRPTYAFLKNGKIACVYCEKGIDKLVILDPKTKTLEDPHLPYTLVQNLISCRGMLYCFAASALDPLAIVSYHLIDQKTSLVSLSFKNPFDEKWISKPEVLEYPSLNGKVGYGFYYPPKNPEYMGGKTTKPPLIVKVHGGPTSRSAARFDLETQYWTSRGFALVDVNYGGSTGYGREYMKRLEGNWGILDVYDSISAAKALVDRGLVDEKKMFIRGGSAGGYTTLAALAFHNVFAGGTSYYGVSDLILLYQDTHKFEAKYTDLLVGSYPEQEELIRKRSPINYINQIHAPILLLQGDQDKIVPPNQTLVIFEALKEKEIPVGMLIFEGEGHGFRNAPNIKKSLDAELYFYQKILHLPCKSFENPPVEILHFDREIKSFDTN